jgi:tetratricopeptide (TPR) repeat protein
MGRTPLGTYLWPGLPQLCRHGSWSALGVAVTFAALLNLALASSLLWSELLVPGLRNGAWTAVVAVWACSAIISYRQDRRRPVAQESGRSEDGFCAALDHYLKGNWFEAEQILNGLLERNPRDLDARLMLAGLFRHAGRYDEAVRQLERLERFEGSQKWELEIRRERQLLEEARTEDDGESAESIRDERAGTSGKISEAA